ncbi:MAG TPA: hypothetical protein VID27_00205 [Blastocatellia bacterium]|jgi:hypothetical protein
MLKPAYRKFAEEFAAKINAQDFEAAHRFFAPWLRDGIAPEHLQEMVESELRETADAAGLEELVYPKTFRVDSNSCTIDDLREIKKREYAYGRRDRRAIPDEITADNFRQWTVIQFMPAEGEDAELDVDAWFDFWMALVEIEGEYKIGYFEFEDPD